MADAAAPAPSLMDLDYFGDFTLYQHPPCMFILWYLGLGFTALWDIISDSSDAAPPPPADE